MSERKTLEKTLAPMQGLRLGGILISNSLCQRAHSSECLWIVALAAWYHTQSSTDHLHFWEMDPTPHSSDVRVYEGLNGTLLQHLKFPRMGQSDRPFSFMYRDSTLLLGSELLYLLPE